MDEQFHFPFKKQLCKVVQLAPKSWTCISLPHPLPSPYGNPHMLNKLKSKIKPSLPYSFPPPPSPAVLPSLAHSQVNTELCPHSPHPMHLQYNLFEAKGEQKVLELGVWEKRQTDSWATWSVPAVQTHRGRHHREVDLFELTGRWWGQTQG